MKDAVSGDMLRLVTNRRLPADFRMEKSGDFNNHHFMLKVIIGIKGEPPELKHLSRVRKINQKRFPK